MERCNGSCFISSNGRVSDEPIRAVVQNADGRHGNANAARVSSLLLETDATVTHDTGTGASCNPFLVEYSQTASDGWNEADKRGIPMFHSREYRRHVSFDYHFLSFLFSFLRDSCFSFLSSLWYSVLLQLLLTLCIDGQRCCLIPITNPLWGFTFRTGSDDQSSLEWEETKSLHAGRNRSFQSSFFFSITREQLPFSTD